MGKDIVRLTTSTLLLLPLILISCSSSTEINGIVFEDSNQNGTKDNNETVLSGVMVSNGIDVVVTNENGKYTLPNDGHFIFVTKPSVYTPTSTWYKDIEDNNLNFGLSRDRVEPSENFSFIHITDIHLNTEDENIIFMRQAIEEINQLSPDFVIATGDLVDGADELTVTQAGELFDRYYHTTMDFNIPLYNTLGNHDVVGIYSDASEETISGYNKGMYQSYFGPTYYSFDYGEYHCLVLDPNDIVDGIQIYRIPDQQLKWLQQDLAYREATPLLVFFHEPTPTWENSTDLLDTLRQHGPAMLFSGHWHQDVLLKSQGFDEQVTGSLCGEWWYGPCPDGNPMGYRVVNVDSSAISSLHKGVNKSRKINVESPISVATDKTTLVAQVYSDYDPVTEVSFFVDNNGPTPMSLSRGKQWYTAITSWDTSGLEPGFHTVVFEARDGVDKFHLEKEFLITDQEIVPISELIANFDTFQGNLVKVRGEADLIIAGEEHGMEGSGAIVFSDNTGTMILIVAECNTPSSPSLISGDTAEVTAVPIKYSWEFLTVSQQYSLIQQYASLLPEGLLVSDETGPKELLLLKLLSGDGIRKIEE
jgi:hypothetical protein